MSWNPTLSSQFIPGNVTNTIPFINLNISGAACNVDGTKLYAIVRGGGIYKSYNAGTNWTTSTDNNNIVNITTQNWVSIVCNSAGTKIVALVDLGYIYLSSDSGFSWTLIDIGVYPRWTMVASSANGETLIAASNQGGAYLSNDSGNTWNLLTTLTGVAGNIWTSVASNSDSSIIAFTAFNEDIYISNDTGTTWTAAGLTFLPWLSIALSATGNNMVAVENYLYTSINAGKNWTRATGLGAKKWTSVVMSSDGFNIIAVSNTNGIYFSNDSGSTWKAYDLNLPSTYNWSYVASSKHFETVLAIRSNTNIYTDRDTTIINTPPPPPAPAPSIPISIALQNKKNTILYSKFTKKKIYSYVHKKSGSDFNSYNKYNKYNNVDSYNRCCVDLYNVYDSIKPPSINLVNNGNHSISVSWNIVSKYNISNLQLYLYCIFYEIVIPIPQYLSTYTFNNLTNGINYYIWIVQSGNIPSINSTYLLNSNIIVATANTATFIPNCPPFIAIPGDKTIDVLWNTPNDNGSAITGYIIQITNAATGISNYLTFNDTISTYHIDGLVNGTTYYVSVRAVNSVGVSGLCTLPITLIVGSYCYEVIATGFLAVSQVHYGPITVPGVVYGVYPGIHEFTFASLYTNAITLISDQLPATNPNGYFVERSWNLLTFNPQNNNATLHDRYDLYGSITDAQNLNNDLLTLPPGTIVVLFTFDEPRGRSNVIRPGVVYCGGCGTDSNGNIFFDGLNFRSCYALIGKAGIGQGNGLEYYNPNTTGWIDIKFAVYKGAINSIRVLSSPGLITHP